MAQENPQSLDMLREGKPSTDPEQNHTTRRELRELPRDATAWNLVEQNREKPRERERETAMCMATMATIDEAHVVTAHPGKLKGRRRARTGQTIGILRPNQWTGVRCILVTELNTHFSTSMVKEWLFVW